MRPRSQQGEAVLSLALFWLLFLSGSLWGSLFVARGLSLYLGPLGNSVDLWRLGAGGAALVASLCAFRFTPTDPMSSLGWLLNSVVLSTACLMLFGPIAQVSFLHAYSGEIVGLCSVAALSSLAFSATGVVVGLGRLSRNLGLFANLANPWRLSALYLGALGIGFTAWRIGQLRALGGCALCLALSAYVLAVALPRLHRQAPSPGSRWGSRFLVALSLGALMASELLVPLEQVLQYPSQIVYQQRSSQSSMVVTSGPFGLELYQDNQLHLSAADSARLVEGMVHPAMTLRRPGARALILGGAHLGLTREIDRYDDVRSWRAVIDDRGLAQLANKLHPPRAPGRQRPNTIEEGEPIVWLSEHDPSDRFDLIFVDTRSPIDFRAGKNYTRRFYELIAQRLTPEGIAVLPLTSEVSSPASFASVLRTVESVGLRTRVLSVPCAGFGRWNLALAGRTQPRAPDPTRLAPRLRYLNDSSLHNLGARPALLRALSGSAVSINRLHSQFLVRLFHDELGESGI